MNPVVGILGAILGVLTAMVIIDKQNPEPPSSPPPVCITKDDNWSI